MNDLRDAAVPTLQERLDGLREWMGASEEFPPPVAEEQVVAFEQQYGITLPEELRAILVQVSDGLGIWPRMEQWVFSKETVATPFNEKDIYGFSMPSLDEYRQEVAEERSEDQEFKDADFDDTYFYDQWISDSLDDYRAWLDDLRTTMTKGTLWLDEFNEYRGYFLVVSGEDSGDVWKIDQETYQDETWDASPECIGSIFDYINER
jgi:hypothetical protein